MNREFCVFKSNKRCDNCGECETCDLDRSKKCNNCGKCLELEGYDMKSIRIDEIIEDEDEIKEYQQETKDIEIHSQHNAEDVNVDAFSEEGIDYINDDYTDEEYKFDYDGLEIIDELDKNVIYISDVDGLDEILQDESKMSQLTYEEFPGVIRFKKEKDIM